MRPSGRASDTMGRMRFYRFQTPVVFVILALAAASASAQVPTLDDCRTQIQQNPANPATYYCVYRSVLAYGEADQAADLLRSSFVANPQVFRIEMFMAWIDRMRGVSGSDDLLWEAIDGMESTGDAYGVVYGGLELAFRLGVNGQFEEAEDLLDRCSEAAGKTDDPTMEARVWIGQAALAQRHADYSQWLHLTLRAQKVVFPDGPYDIQSTVLDNLGAAYWYLCRYQEAYDAFEKAAGICEAAQDLWGQARSVFNMALSAVSLLHQGSMEITEYRELLEKGEALAVESGNALAVTEIGLLQGCQHRGEEALPYFEKALKSARHRSLIQAEINALRLIGIELAEMGQQYFEESETHFQLAKQRARETGQDVLMGEILGAEARLKAVNNSREEATASHLIALDCIEKLRAPQVGGTIRAQAFTRWTDVYYRLAGFLLQGSVTSSTPEDDRALAFQTLERFRARELLEKLETPQRIYRSVSQSATYLEHQKVLRQISAVQRALSDSGLGPEDRTKALDELADLESLELDLRDQLIRESPAFAALYQPVIPDLGTIQAQLKPDQALLSYQLWDGESSKELPLEIGQSWLMLVTRDQVRTFALPKRRDLRARVRILEGLLLSARDSSVASANAASVRLYEDLFQEALATLPEAVRSLILIPDDVLFGCPFGALRSSAGAMPEGSRFEISIVPSAAVWLHLKTANPDSGAGQNSAALIFFDPAISDSQAGFSDFRAADPWMEGVQLAPLRYAGREAQYLKRAAGKGSLVVTGNAASETVFKATSFSDFGIINLVTHAVVDENQPERSAILLAPGSDLEDGFLQVREISVLDLDGQLVVLSSCRSSSGRILGGEGAQSLARAFLEAGAGAVLASLWPLEDQKASVLFGNFSNALGQGQTVGGALRSVQLAAIESGMAADSWAGLVIHGDADLRPIPAPVARNWMWILSGILMATSVGVFRARRSRRKVSY